MRSEALLKAVLLCVLRRPANFLAGAAADAVDLRELCRAADDGSGGAADDGSSEDSSDGYESDGYESDGYDGASAGSEAPGEETFVTAPEDRQACDQTNCREDRQTHRRMATRSEEACEEVCEDSEEGPACPDRGVSPEQQAAGRAPAATSPPAPSALPLWVNRRQLDV